MKQLKCPGLVKNQWTLTMDVYDLVAQLFLPSFFLDFSLFSITIYQKQCHSHCFLRLRNSLSKPFRLPFESSESFPVPLVPLPPSIHPHAAFTLPTTRARRTIPRRRQRRRKWLHGKHLLSHYTFYLSLCMAKWTQGRGAFVICDAV